MSQTPQKRKWWEKPANAWKSCGALAVLVLGVLIALQWEDSTDKDSIRNIIFALGGVGAFLGVWLASIRNMDFTRQVDEQTKQINLLTEQVKTQTRQTDLQTQQVRSETLSRCIEQIGHENSSAIRTAGIRGLEILAQDYQNDVRLLQHLCAILQGIIDAHAPSRRLGILLTLLQTKELPPVWHLPTVLSTAKLNDQEKAEVERWAVHWQAHKVNAEQAIDTFAHIFAIAPTTLRGLDLSHRYLPGLGLSAREIGKSSLRKTSLSFSCLPHATLLHMDLSESGFWNTYLRGAPFLWTHLKKAHLLETDLRGADLREAKLQKARFYKVKLKDANFANANLAGAVYYENENDCTKDATNNPPMLGIPVTPEWLKAQGAKNCDKAKFSEDSDD